MIGSIITDCADDNARARQELRFHSLFGVQPTFIGLGDKKPDIEAAGNLLDQLDIVSHLPKSADNNHAIILLNIAPRGEAVRKKWENGAPFCYFRYDNALVVSTFAGANLSLVAERKLVDTVELLDIAAVTAAALEWGEIVPDHANFINYTQFRSLEFMQLAAYWIASGRAVPSKPEKLTAKSDPLGKVWCIDNFGNAKTTLLPKDINFAEGKSIRLADGKMAVYYRRLADVPKEATALVIGSSGYGSNRFLELVVPWNDLGQPHSESAATRHNLQIGSPVLAG